MHAIYIITVAKIIMHMFLLLPDIETFYSLRMEEAVVVPDL